MADISKTVLIRSDDPEQIVHCIDVIGRSAIRFEVFKAIYTGQKKQRTIADIINLTSFNEKQIRKVLSELKDHHLCIVEGRGDGTLVTKDEFCRKNRDQIIRGVENPAAKARIATKRASRVAPVEKSMAYKFKPTDVGALRRPRRKHRKKATIAFFTTNPDADLRTDQEYRAVLQRHKESPNRDKIHLENVCAASFEDFIQALNDLNPDIVHFSGHGDRSSVLFDGDSIGAADVEVDFELLKTVMLARDQKPKVLVLNSCFGALGSHELVSTAQAVVAMADEIDDTAAAVFARQMYASLFSGQSIDVSVTQGKAVMKAMNIEDADLPELNFETGNDPKTIKLF